MFRLIKTLCSVARNQTLYSLSTFLSSRIVIDRLITIDRFERQLNTTLAQIQQQIPAQFVQTLESIRLSQQGNVLASVFSSNWQYLVQNNDRSSGAPLTRQPVVYENGTCSCALSPQCSMPATAFTNNGTVYHMLNGLRFGCTILELFLQSSLEYFYTESCLDPMLDGMFVKPPSNSSIHLECFKLFQTDRP